MPSLKDLHCSIELPDHENQLREFGTAYGDGSVETFLAVPDRAQPFAIRLTSTKFIATGLAMYVFIDGVYQCNRNRQNLKLRNPPDRKALVEFVVRQKEERQDDGTMISRNWNFEKLNIVAANEAPETCSPKVLANLGCIEVIVLRCAGVRNAKSASAKAKPMNLDGAGDMPDQFLGLDRSPQSQAPQYDDRAWEFIQVGSRYGAPMSGTSHYQSGPPPLLAAPSYALRANHNSSVPQSSSRLHEVWGSPETLASSIQYGSGPVPHQSRAASMNAPVPSKAGAPTTNMPFDPQSLDRALANSIKRGMDRYDASPQVPRIPFVTPDMSSSQVPGSWPSPQGSSTFRITHPAHGLGTCLPPPPPPPPLPSALGPDPAPHHTDLGWNEGVSQMSNGWGDCHGWESGGEEDTRSTWSLSQQASGANEWSTSNYQRKHEPTVAGWGSPSAFASSPAAQTAYSSRWNHSSDFHTAQSRPSASIRESAVDDDGWTHVKANSDSSDSWALPVHHSDSISHVAGPTIAAPVDQVGDLLSEKLRSLKQIEETRRRSVFTTSQEDQNLFAQLPSNAFSTFERSIRGASENKMLPLGWDHRDIVLSADWPCACGDTDRMVQDGSPAGDAQEITTRKPKRDTHVKSGDLKTSDTSWQADINGWTALQKAKTLASQPNPWIEMAETKNQISKTRPSKYQHLRHSTKERPANGHKQFPPAPLKTKSTAVSGRTGVEAEPLLKVTKELVNKRGVEHQVRAGEGTKYGHAISRPEYLDSLEKPYATFRFKYRAHGMLRDLLGKDVVPSDTTLFTTKPIDPLATGQLATATRFNQVKQKLKEVPKDALIDGLLHLQTKLESEKMDRAATATETVGMNRTKDWVRRQSRDASEYEKGSQNRMSDESWGSDEGWN